MEQAKTTVKTLSRPSPSSRHYGRTSVCSRGDHARAGGFEDKRSARIKKYVEAVGMSSCMMYALKYYGTPSAPNFLDISIL